MKHGFLLIDKPTGITSHDAVSKVRRALLERKVGHLGTLDPAASGLLVMAVGPKALKVIEFFKDLSKEYIAEIKCGAVSSTYDSEGVIEEVEPKSGWKVPDEIQVRDILRTNFLGDITQVPPAHSAVHVDGKRAYEMARRGESVDVPPRSICINECELLEYDYPKIVLRVACSSGTYIRTLAHDLGDRLRCSAYLSGLKRTKVGEWSLDFAITPDAIAWSDIIPLKEVLVSFGGIDLTEAELEDVRCGRNINHQVKPDTFGWFDGLPVAVLVPAKDGTRKAHARKVI